MTTVERKSASRLATPSVRGTRRRRRTGRVMWATQRPWVPYYRVPVSWHPTGCQAARNICCGEDAAGLARKQRAVEGRLVEAVTAAMRAHRQAVGLQESGCATLRNLGCGEFPEAPARSQRAAEAGALEAVVGAMLAHQQVAGVQEQGCGALRSLCCSTDDAARARGQHAAEVWVPPPPLCMHMHTILPACVLSVARSPPPPPCPACR